VAELLRADLARLPPATLRNRVEQLAPVGQHGLQPINELRVSRRIPAPSRGA
jgi:hypothetical protein